MSEELELTLLVASVIAASAAQEAPKAEDGLSMLKVGQGVNLRDHGSANSIGFVEQEVQLSQTVVEIGPDYVVLKDIAGVKDVLVPVYSLKAVEKVQVEVE